MRVSVGPVSIDSAQVHDGRAVTEISDRRNIVRDIQQGETGLPAEPSEQLQYPRPNRDIQHGDGFVGHNESRAHHHRARDGHPLTLSSAELVGIAVEKDLRGTKPDDVQRLKNPIHELLPFG